MTHRYSKGSVCRLLMTTMLVMPGFTVSSVLAEADAAAPSPQRITGTSLEERVARLETLLEQLLSRMTVQDAQLSDQAAILKAEADEIKELQIKVRREEEQLQAMDEEIQEVATNVIRDRQPGFSVGNTKVTYGGFVKIDATMTRFSDTQGPASGVSSSSLLRDFYLPGLLPVGGGGSATVFDFNPRETRFLFKTATPFDGGEIGSHIEFDFQVTSGGNERVSNSFVPRVRQAFLTYKGWLIGQAWSTFQDVAALPENLDFIGPAEGTTFDRQPMIRYTTGNWEVALEQSETTLTAPTGARITPGGDRLPDVATRYTHKGDWGQIRIAALLRELRVEDSLLPGFDQDSAFGYGLSLSGKLKVGERDDFRFMGTVGEGLGRYVGTNLVNGVAVDMTTGELEAIPTYNGFASYRHFWNAKWRSNLSVGYFRADNPVALTTDAVTNEAMSVHANLLYSPEPALTFGLEYTYARRETEGGLSGTMNRTMFSAKYGF